MSRASVTAGLALGPVLAAAALGGPVHAQIAPDRYGPAPAGPAAPSSYGPGPAGPLAPSSYGVAPSPAGGLRGRMLSWPGKIAVAPPAPVYAPAPGYGAPAYATRSSPRYAPSSYAGRRAYGPPVAYGPAPEAGGTYYRAPAPRAYPPQSAYAPRPEAQFAYPARTAAPPAAYRQPPQDAPAPSENGAAGRQDGWRPVFAASPSPAPPPGSARPSAPAASRFASLPPPRGSAARRYGYDAPDTHAVRFYSVHRPFGLQPDPAPIPPQFFTNTADLAAPPGPLLTERTSAASTGTSRSVRATPDTSAN